MENVLRSPNSLKDIIDKLDIGKLETATNDLNMLRNVVKIMLLNDDDLYDGLVKKVNANDTRGLVKKTHYNAKIKDI